MIYKLFDFFARMSCLSFPKSLFAREFLAVFSEFTSKNVRIISVILLNNNNNNNDNDNNNNNSDNSK